MHSLDLPPILRTYLLVEGGQAGVLSWQCDLVPEPQCPRLPEAHLCFGLVLLEEATLLQVQVEAVVQE